MKFLVSGGRWAEGASAEGSWREEGCGVGRMDAGRGTSWRGANGAVLPGSLGVTCSRLREEVPCLETQP